MNVELLVFNNFNEAMFVETLKHMHDTGSSDAYITRGKKVYFKKDGEIMVASKGIIDPSAYDNFLKSITTAAIPNVIRSGKPHSMGFSLKKAKLADGSISNLRFRIQIASCDSRKSMTMVVREIPLVPPNPEQLGLDESIVSVQLEFRHGIGFVCGATNSGKSTSIASLIKIMLLNIPRRIMSLEDPREFIYDMLLNPVGIIDQMEVPHDIGTYAEGIENALRMSPDGIFVGEVRSMDTADALLQASETGHNILTTLHVGRGHLLFQRLASFYQGEQRDRIISKSIDQTNFILVQKLIHRIDGGRVAVREFIVLDSQLKEQLHRTKLDEISVVLKKMIEDYGISMTADAMNLYNNEIISKDEHNSLCYTIAELGHVIR
ncbi:MAG: ATPase, T2SS/T4P/T4SS family [Pseudomonadota bacterium]